MWADAVDAEIHATVCGDSTKPTICAPAQRLPPQKKKFRDPANERAPSRRGEERPGAQCTSSGGSRTCRQR